MEQHSTPAKRAAGERIRKDERKVGLCQLAGPELFLLLHSRVCCMHSALALACQQAASLLCCTFACMLTALHCCK